MKKIISILLSTAMIICVLAGCGTKSQAPKALQAAAAVLPEEAYEGSPIQFIEGDDYSEWWNTKRAQLEAVRDVQPELDGFYESLMKELLSAEKNTVCSPLNIYMALAMVAETAKGETQSQILDLLGASDIGKLRDYANKLWRSSYYEIPTYTCQLANSLWLGEDINYNEAVLKTLAEDYYADSFAGQLSSDEMNKAFREWLDEHTGGLLKEYTEEAGIRNDENVPDSRSVMELVSAIYMKGMWINPFFADQTDKQTFHGASGDTECDMMHQNGIDSYFWGDHFSGVTQSIDNGGRMYFFLPDEDADLSDIINDPQVMEVIRNGLYDGYENTKYIIVNKSIPKFSVSSKHDLIDSLEALGIVDAFDSELADFSPLVSDMPVWISKADHAAMVEIDEEGVAGAAYTDFGYAGAGMPPDETVDFVLDRPFMFAVTGSDGSILFAGTVCDLD